MKIPHLTQPALLATIVWASILTFLIVVAALMMRPVADDYAYFADPLINNPFKFAWHYYMDWTGRSSQAFWMSSLYRIFGSSVVAYGTILQLLLLVASAVVFCYSAIFKSLTTSHIKVITTGLVVTILSIYMAPSVFDSTLWITSSTVYIGSLIGILLSISFAIYIIRNKISSLIYLIPLALVAFLSQLFSEPSSVIMIVLSTIAAGLAILYRNAVAIKASIIYASSALLGFLYMYFSPGTRVRQGALENKVDIYDILLNSFGDFSRLTYIFQSHRIILILISALVFSLVIGSALKKYRLIFSITSLVLAILIPYMLFAMARYTMGDYLPARALTVPVTLSSIFIALLIALNLPLLWNKLRLNEGALSFVVLLVLPVSLLLTAKDTLPTIQAVAIRENLYDGREASIKEQLAQAPRTLYFEPLPILLANSDAVDFYYNQTPPAWFEDGFRRYYGIPLQTQITYETQPDGYCVSGHTPGWLGAVNCTTQQKLQPHQP